MNASETTGRWRFGTSVALLTRYGLGLLFIYMGLQKTLHPVEFLKLVRQYDLFHHYLPLNFVASTLPWFEIFCGTLLMLGVAVRGTAVLLVGMLVPFTVAIFLRAKAMSVTGGLPFCTIKFDCGCGAGEVLICKKLAENVMLMGLAMFLACWKIHLFCWRGALLPEQRQQVNKDDLLSTPTVE
ncbi:MAG: DoxX family protein [Verrucomicrobiales bacterium]|nr:DoxX family protein [Verrucomicrobiales bacterium]